MNNFQINFYKLRDPPGPAKLLLDPPSYRRTHQYPPALDGPHRNLDTTQGPSKIPFLYLVDYVKKFNINNILETVEGAASLAGPSNTFNKEFLVFNKRNFGASWAPPERDPPKLTF